LKVKSTRSKPSKIKNKAPKARSGFEKKVMAFLDSQECAVQYESEVVYYTVPERSTDTPTSRSMAGFVNEGQVALSRHQEDQARPSTESRHQATHAVHARPANRKGSKTRYSDVAKKLGIDFEISPKGTVPTRWITG
jgi:hypothetical protein